MEKDGDPIEKWDNFFEYIQKDFFLPKYIEQHYNKCQHLRQSKDNFMYIYTDDFYRLMDRIGVQEEEKFLVLKYIN